MASNQARRKSTRKSHVSSSSSSLTSDQTDRKSEIRASLRNFTVEDDKEEDDFLAGLIGGNGGAKKEKEKKKSKKSTRKMGGIAEDNADDAAAKKSKRKSSRKIRKAKEEDDDDDDGANFYEGGLNDGSKDDGDSAPKSFRNSARQLMDKAIRAASPGRMRSKSPGKASIRASMRTRNRSKSPGRLRNKVNDSGNGSGSEDRPTRSTRRASSAGRLKKRPESAGRMKQRTSSPGRMKKAPDSSPGRTKKPDSSPGRNRQRAGSAGRLRKRSQSPGALRKTNRERRKGSIRPSANGEGGLGESRRRGSDPARSNERPSEPSSTGDVKPMVPKRSTHDFGNGEAALKDQGQSYSDLQDELNRYKIKRNHSAGAATSRAKREDDGVTKPNSVMNNRETGRRTRSNSLKNLVQYTNEEIHSTSYFASDHVLINRERMKRSIKPLNRNIAMDNLARKIAEEMAVAKGLTPLTTTYVGNVLRGDNIRSIHRSTMMNKEGQERKNILNVYFQEMGVGTCLGDDELLYICQLFSERLELQLTDTKPKRDNSLKPTNSL